MQIGSNADFSNVKVIGGADVWSYPVDIPGPYPFYESYMTDTTFRGFGTDRYIMNCTSTIITNTEKLETCATNSDRLTTNSKNLTDVFTSYGYDGYVKIRHLDP